ncbi:hypothetical protein ACLB1S_12665 [Escherichia coli]
MTTPLKKIVIVGGGAGGLEMATQLGHKLGRKKKAKITLVNGTTSPPVETAAARSGDWLA